MNIIERIFNLSIHVTQRKQVHFWYFRIFEFLPSLIKLESFLDIIEKKRLKRFIFKKDKIIFTISHGLLRVLMGSYLRMHPSEVRFCYSSHGKPLLAPEMNPDDLRFNLSHAEDSFVCAVTREREVGVDVETLNRDIDIDGIARKFFTCNEAAALRCVAQESRQKVFFRIWTRKEALVKAVGKGLLLPIHALDVLPNDKWVEEAPADQTISIEGRQWTVLSIFIDEYHDASLAVEGDSVETMMMEKILDFDLSQ